MQPSEYYQSILDSIDSELERRVFDVLARHIGDPVSRSEMISILYGEDINEDEMGNNPRDRAIRRCIENLRSRDFPIVSTSHDAGYCLSDDPLKIDRCVAEDRSRIDHMQAKINHLLRSKSMAHDLHQWRKGEELPVQARMF